MALTTNWGKLENCMRTKYKRNKTKLYDTGHRLSTSYQDWRRQCLSRDGYQCTKCRARKNLHVHHINSWHNNEHKDRFLVANGITLCKECHQEQHSFKFYTKRKG